jgi:hypothetical protein
MHFGGVSGGGMHFGGMPSSGMVTGRSAFVPGGSHSVGASPAGPHIFGNKFNHSNRFNNANRFDRDDFRHHHRFRNFAFVGAPFFDDFSGYGTECWQQEWTSYGLQWVNVCNGYGY